MGVYDLPTSLIIGEVVYPIRYGWRAVLDIFAAFNDPDLDDDMKMDAMVRILYPNWEDIPFLHMQEAIEKACEFLDCGMKHDGRPKPRTMDWEQDWALIIPAVNHAAKREVRSDPDIHWWTFFGWYMSIEGGTFSSVLHIRQKKAKHTKLEKWEEEFYRENRHLIDLRNPESEEIQQEKENLLKWL